MPRARPVDTDAPGVPDGSVAHKTTVMGYTIRYLYPFRVRGRPHVLVVSIRRGRRRALDDPEYLTRWLEERARRR